ncbi:hypothetical protein [Terrisporobacter sp.]
MKYEIQRQSKIDPKIFTAIAWSDNRMYAEEIMEALKLLYGAEVRIVEMSVIEAENRKWLNDSKRRK